MVPSKPGQKPKDRSRDIEIVHDPTVEFEKIDKMVSSKLGGEVEGTKLGNTVEKADGNSEGVAEGKTDGNKEGVPDGNSDGVSEGNIEGPND